MSGNILITTIVGGGIATGVCWGEIRDAAKYPTVRRKLPHKKKELIIQPKMSAVPRSRTPAVHSTEQVGRGKLRNRRGFSCSLCLPLEGSFVSYALGQGRQTSSLHHSSSSTRDHFSICSESR